MKQTTETELKEKLAQFAGFQKGSPVYFDWKWEYPQGASHPDLPDFPHDIAACIEYLGPKFQAWEVAYSGYHSVVPKYRAAVTWYGEYFIFYSEALAMAFSRAVEQAIDKGAK